MALAVALARVPGSAAYTATSVRSPLLMRIRPHTRLASHKAPTTLRPNLSALKRRAPAPTSLPAKDTSKPIPPIQTSQTPSPSSPPTGSQSPPPMRGTAVTLTSYAYMRDIARKTAPTTLYQAPNHFWMYASSWATGAFCFAYAGYHLTTIYYNPPTGLAWYVPKMFGVICVAMGALGSYYILRSSNVIYRIRVLPQSQTSTSPGAAGVQTGSSVAQIVSQKITELPLEIEVKRMLPFLPARVVNTTTSSVSMDGTLAKPAPQHLSEAERHELRLAQERARAAAVQYEKDHLMTAPFRHFARGAQTAWHGVKQALVGSGFVRVKVEGAGKGTYKLDVTNGLALNEGRVLDKLVKIEMKEAPKGLQLYRS
ncbi:hypothetical protein CFIMG_007751RA00001 [Ceratocystis fimbriata CBS 114723]|uniref:Uncharacterized protein n=1 Tax=Ceratocystis fimbriata CBS 114723 TaxID=1035309 RepID=A0A2C5WUE8_9PEZI|nr:hypothetical protein CFIMG_007751RA00001 [Ceratocystis fimbriata CBS 114723]